MRALVLGGTGHIGGHLVPLLLESGLDVAVLSRGRTPPPDAAAWERVEYVRAEYARDDPGWRGVVEETDADVVVDLLGSDLPALYETVRGRSPHLVVCGSLWMYGPPRLVPTPEETQGPCEFPDYARRWREIRETRERADAEGIPFTALMPSNICGPGKIPLEARGGRSPDIHRAHARGEPVRLPDGCDTLVAPCDVEDVAEAFHRAVTRREDAAGEVLNVGPARALTMPAFVAAYGRIHGVEIPLEWIDRERFFAHHMPDPGANYHFRAHMAPDVRRIREVLGFEPRWTPREAMERAVAWMREERILDG